MLNLQLVLCMVECSVKRCLIRLVSTEIVFEESAWGCVLPRYLHRYLQHGLVRLIQQVSYHKGVAGLVITDEDFGLKILTGY